MGLLKGWGGTYIIHNVGENGTAQGRAGDLVVEVYKP